MIKSIQILTPRSRALLRSTFHSSVLSVAALGFIGTVATAQTATQAPSPSPAQSPAPQQQPADPAAAAQMEKVKNQLIEVDTRIRAVQQKALQSETVKEKRDVYDKTLRTAMVKEEPEVKSMLEKQDNLVDELKKQSAELSKPAEQRSPEFQKNFQEYQKLKETLSPIAQRSSEKPEVAETLKEFQTVLTTEMAKVEPTVPQLIQQRGELINKYQQLVQAGR